MDKVIGKRILVMFVALVMCFGGALVMISDEGYAQGDTILDVALQEQPSTRNILGARDVWTHYVLDPVYDTVTKTLPITDELVPYILKGTDANGNGVFDDNEYGVFTSVPGKPLEVTAYYDFNYVYFHDGYQATLEDLLFTYHLDALDPKTIALDVLKDKSNFPGSNYTTTRWLWLNKLKGFNPTTSWAITTKDYSDPGYNVSLRGAIHFNQQASYWDFFRSTLSWRLLPRYLWEGTGCIYEKGLGTFNCNIHRNTDGSPMDSFGRAYDGKNGVPPVTPDAFDFSLAKSWDLPDEYVVGTGPFTFDTWIPGQFSRIGRYDDYYVGEPYLHKPYIEAMRFKVFKTTQTAVFALRSGDVDFISWSVPPAFIPELSNDPNVALSSSQPKGFTYLTFNMRFEPFGYPMGDPMNGDTGKNFRQAISYLIDKNTIVSSLLQNYGIKGDSPVSPTLAKWYNASLPQFFYDPAAADALLDTYDPWQPSDGCDPSGAGCRNFPGIGTSSIEIITPNADYDPIRAASATLISQAMRDVGINTRSTPMAMDMIITKIGARDFQMVILDNRIGVEPPEYLFSFFYSRNSAQGDNSPGYQSDEFDDMILRAREELDTQKQVGLIKQAQGILAEDRPYDALYFRQNIEAYRSDRFVNWTVGPFDSIYSYWSWLGIHEPQLDMVRIFTTIQTDVLTSDTAELTATVTDTYGQRLDGATVYIYVDSWSGEFINGPIRSNFVSGQSDSNGEFGVIYDPLVLQNNDPPVTVLMHAWAKYPGYSDSKNLTDSIRVHSEPEEFLSIVTSLPEGDMVAGGGTIPIGLQIIDKHGNPVDGANVTVYSNPAAMMSPGSGATDSNGHVKGQAYMLFLAPAVLDDVTHLVTFQAYKSGYGASEESLTIDVVYNEKPEVAITSISTGQTLSGSVQVMGSASDPDGDQELVRVEVSIDGGIWNVAIGTKLWTYYLDTRQFSYGNHTIAARSFDGLVYSNPDSVVVKFDNNEQPIITVISISNGQTLSDEVDVVGTASDPDGNGTIVQVEVKVDSGNWQNATGTSSWSFMLDTTDLENGDHVLYFRAYDGMEYSTTVAVMVTVDNEIVTDCPDGSECGGISSILIWIGLLIVIIVVVLVALLFWARRVRKTEPPEFPDELEQTEEVSESIPPEEKKTVK